MQDSYNMHMHGIVSGGGLTKGRQIRYYGFLNNQTKTADLKNIIKLQGGQRFLRHYVGMNEAFR